MKNLITPSRLALGASFAFVLILSGCGDKTAAPDSRGTASTPAADNSAKNARDREDATLTAGDQGNSPADREITQKIRKSLVSDSSGYSMTAKNVKIITVNGKVTVRGPVKTTAEKTGIVAIAKAIAGDGNVDDQLEVKSAP